MSNLQKILYAEDDADIRTITKLCFLNSGYDLQECETGKEVLDKVESFKPQLVILDVMMPVMDGITTFNELKKMELSKSIAVIFMTAKINSQEIIKYKKMGSIGVICKPFDPNILVTEIVNLYNCFSEGKL